MPSRKSDLFFIILLSGLCLTRAASAVGLSTPFANVVIDNVRAGKKTPAKDLLGHDLALTNLGTASVTVQIEALIPSKEQLKGNAEGIPETNWISISPNLLEIPALATAECHIMIHVPRKALYKGKKYQVMIWSHSISTKAGSVLINTGLLSRVTFNVQK